MPKQKIDNIGYLLICLFLILLTYAGWLSAKSIQWDVLETMESKTLVLPPPATPSAQNQ